MYFVQVDNAKCTGCEECVDICPEAVFEMDGDKSNPANSSACVFCESCLGVCPSEAITITEM